MKWDGFSLEKEGFTSDTGEPFVVFQFLMHKYSFAVLSFADRDVVHFVGKSKKNRAFFDRICGAVQMFFSELNWRKISSSKWPHKKTNKLLLKRKPLELFNSIHIFGRGGNHLCIDELGQRNKTTSVAMDLYVLPPRLILKKSGKDSGCVLLMINEGTALLHQKRRLVLIHQIHHSCAWKM